VAKPPSMAPPWPPGSVGFLLTESLDVRAKLGGKIGYEKAN
jgi:hypothetical protein